MEKPTTRVRAHMVLPKALLEEFDQRVGGRRRSEQIAALMEDWLRRERAKEVFTRLAGFVKDEDHPEWATEEGFQAWLRDVRHSSDPWDSIRPVLSASEDPDGADNGALPA